MIMSDSDAREINDKLDQIFGILKGDGGENMGLVQKVNILWLLVLRWPIVIVSAIGGSVITITAQQLLK